ncbi:MAG: PIG-L deacetylase family protein [Actinomycetota bacterium]|nr:PIG-L family deacetylase [Actinomycetota bacterium]
MQFDDQLAIERAMVIVAHPDDAEFGSSGTVALWTRAGVEVTYVLATNGASGSSDPNMTRERLAGIRKTEQEAAAAVLGVARVVWLGFEDGYLEPTLELRKSIAREVRRYKPDAIITSDPTIRWWGEGYINHPDHIAVGECVLRTVNPDASSGLMFPELWREEGLAPHKPKALFLVNSDPADVFVDITETMDTKIKALECHVCQVGDWPVGDFMRERNRQRGAEKGMQYAEAYKLFRLEED